MYVAVAGNIGAGKSSLTKVLSSRYHLSPVYEAVDENPYLEDFYSDMRRYAFHSQVFFLAARLKQHLREVNPGRRVIQDRTVYEDAAIFARLLHDDGVMDDRDHASYRTLYHAVLAALRPPDLLIYLRAGLGTLKRHIAQRGRAYEANIEDGYLLRLGDLYERWVEDYSLSPVVVVPADDLDFVNDQADLKKVLDLLERSGLTAPVVR
ncbi:MAG: deoxynucleoside kinase [Trueperaceae bacterium]|nr:deoxynucleoside kinase [Trueperaceae bacterium]MCC6311658.1 deoxynucleoside kinase [Trueperaceae bacterium]MCW5820178.1 deoxynucleoside kinase [Trueperaceae bacterium]